MGPGKAVRPEVEPYFGSVAWANELLRLGIGVCKGTYAPEVLGNRLLEVRLYRDLLRDHGYWWQSRILGIWLRRLVRGQGSSRSGLRTRKGPRGPLVGGAHAVGPSVDAVGKKRDRRILGL